MTNLLIRTLLALTLVPVLACGDGTLEPPKIPGAPVLKDRGGRADASADAVFLSFEFDGEVLVTSTWNIQQSVEDQMLYTIGALNGDTSIGRLDKLVLSDITTGAEGDLTRVHYHATMPVAWGKKNNVPQSYTLTLPANISYGAQSDFTDKYKDSCVDYGAHDVDASSMWYYYRPNAYNCKLADEDVVSFTASVSPSTLQTIGKFPEYDKVWEDDALRVVAVFGKYEDGETSSSDGGIAAYNRFVSRVKSTFANDNLTTVPADVPSQPGVDVPDVAFSATLSDGKAVEIVALLVDNVRTAGETFNARYAELSPNADLIAYNGHAGLGANIRALARKGKWVAGQYAIVFMNGCDTYAYVDTALADAHAAVNDDDDKGTKYVDVVMNALPSYFHSMANATLALVDGLLAYEAPKTYEQIFAGVDRSQVILVSGEEDNTFVPGGGGGGGGGGGEPWGGLSETGSVARDDEVRYATPTLAPGRYLFELSGDGDADLYVRIGTAPTVDLYDCRPYLEGSAESCLVDLPTAAPIHVMVRGWADTTDFALIGQSQ